MFYLWFLNAVWRQPPLSSSSAMEYLPIRQQHSEYSMSCWFKTTFYDKAFVKKTKQTKKTQQQLWFTCLILTTVKDTQTVSKFRVFCRRLGEKSSKDQNEREADYLLQSLKGAELGPKSFRLFLFMRYLVSFELRTWLKSNTPEVKANIWTQVWLRGVDVGRWVLQLWSRKRYPTPVRRHGEQTQVS